MRVVTALLLLVFSAGVLYAESASFRRPGPEILAGLGIEPAECDPSESSRYPDHIVVSCGTTDESLKSMKKIWRKAVRRGALEEYVRWDGAPWRGTSDTEKTMYVQFGGAPVAVSIDFARGVAAVRWPDRYPRCHTGHEFEWFARGGDALGPSSLERVDPIFPEQARIQRSGGAVMGSYVVDASGRVIDVCVLAAHPPGVGFEQATVDALMQSTFEPATRNGQPIAVAATFSMEFSIHPDGSWTSALVQSFFEHIAIVKPR